MPLLDKLEMNQCNFPTIEITKIDKTGKIRRTIVEETHNHSTQYNLPSTTTTQHNKS